MARAAHRRGRVAVRPRRPAKIPRNAARRARAVHAPVQVERFLVGALTLLSKRFATACRAILTTSKLGAFARWTDDAEHADAKDPKKGKGEKSKPSPNAKAASVLAGQMRSAASRTFSEQAVRAATEQAARRLESHSKDQFKKLDVKIEKEPDLKWLYKGWVKDISERVSAMGEEQVDKLEAILSEGHTRHVTSIAKDIESQLGVTTSRAEFIARDSVLTLNSKVTRHRQRAAGFRFYVWTSVADDRVRPHHVELDGKVFEIDGDGDEEDGHPGMAPNCRCVQFPIESENDGKDEEDDGDQPDDKDSPEPDDAEPDKQDDAPEPDDQADEEDA